MEQRDPRTHAVIGAAMEVHRVLGHGFTEPVYQKALAVELELQKIPFIPQVGLEVSYKGRKLCLYRCDFLCYESVLVEIKALDDLAGRDESQIINYLKATGQRIGLLINFGRPSLQFKRFIHGPEQHAPR